MFNPISLRNLNSPQYVDRIYADDPRLYRRDPYRLKYLYDGQLPTLEECDISESPVNQNFLNKLFGATPGKPLKIPIEALSIEISTKSLLYMGAGAIGLLLLNKFINKKL